MNSPWPTVLLEDVLALDLDRVSVVSGESYPMVGVYSYGKGLFHRESVDGGKTSYKTFYRLKADHVVMSQLFGWEGALALSSEDVAGRYVSPQFPTFLCSQDHISRDYLGWFLQTPPFIMELGSKTKGMGDRRRTLNPDALLSCHIPLPPLDEQQRIATKVEALARRVKEALKLQAKTGTARSTLPVAMAHRTDLPEEEKLRFGWRRQTLGDILSEVIDPCPVEVGKQYPSVGIYSFAKGLFGKPPLNGSEIKAKTLYRLRSGQIVYGRLNAYEGAFALVPDEFDNSYVSNEFPAFDCDRKQVIPEFIISYLQSPTVWEDFFRKSRGVGGKSGNRRVRFKPNAFLEYSILVPPLDYQEKIKSALVKTASIREHSAGTEKRLNALMPAILDKAFKGELI